MTIRNVWEKWQSRKGAETSFYTIHTLVWYEDRDHIGVEDVSCDLHLRSKESIKTKRKNDDETKGLKRRYNIIHI